MAVNDCKVMRAAITIARSGRANRTTRRRRGFERGAHLLAGGLGGGGASSSSSSSLGGIIPAVAGWPPAAEQSKGIGGGAETSLVGKKMEAGGGRRGEGGERGAGAAPRRNGRGCSMLQRAKKDGRGGLAATAPGGWRLARSLHCVLEPYPAAGAPPPWPHPRARQGAGCSQADLCFTRPQSALRWVDLQYPKMLVRPFCLKFCSAMQKVRHAIYWVLPRRFEPCRLRRLDRITKLVSSKGRRGRVVKAVDLNDRVWG